MQVAVLPDDAPAAAGDARAKALAVDALADEGGDVLHLRCAHGQRLVVARHGVRREAQRRELLAVAPDVLEALQLVRAQRRRRRAPLLATPASSREGCTPLEYLQISTRTTESEQSPY